MEARACNRTAKAMPEELPEESYTEARRETTVGGESHSTPGGRSGGSDAAGVGIA